MTSAAPLLALAQISGDLVAGLVIGITLGFLAGPLVRHVLAVREWRAAAGEARLTDELLARLPVASSTGVADVEAAAEAERSRDGRREADPVAVRWRTSR